MCWWSTCGGLQETLSAAGFILARRCAPQQRIHVHYCTADAGEISQWCRSFPQAHFGFTAAVRTFSDVQRAGLRSVPMDRLLLETDSPHVKVDSGVRAFLGEVGQLVADIRGEPLADVLGAYISKVFSHGKST